MMCKRQAVYKIRAFIAILAVSFLTAIPSAVLGTNFGISNDLNGLWATTTQDTTDAPVIVYQEGNEIRMMCTFDYQGKKVAWHSSGTITGNIVKTRFHITTNTKPGDWEADGTHDLTLSPDGRHLAGIGKSQSGFSYKIQFRRIK